MGCFSFICKECGEPILSNSFSGEKVKLFLLKEGTVIQDMEGQYNSYGQVFTEDLKDSIQWKDLNPSDIHGSSWSKVCDLMFNKDTSNGIAAIHSECLKEGMVPTTRSEDDPDQGWGSEGQLMGDSDEEYDYDQH